MMFGLLLVSIVADYSGCGSVVTTLLSHSRLVMLLINECWADLIFLEKKKKKK